MIKYLKEIWSDYVKLYKSLSFLQKYFLLLLLALLAYLPLMRGYVNTHDEMWTLLMARKPFDEMMKIVIADDGNPPLYYIYERFWDYFDNDKLNVFWSRFGNFFILFLTSLLGLFPIRRLFGDRVSLLFCALVFIMPPSFFLVTDIRGYCLSGLLVAGAFVYALCICYNNKRGDWFWLALCSLLGMYNHYLCGIWNILIWGGLFLYLLRQKRYKDIGKMFLWGAFVSLAYLPWLLVFINQYGSMKANWYVKKGYVLQACWGFLFDFKYNTGFLLTLLAAFLWTLLFEFVSGNNAKKTHKQTVIAFLWLCLFFYAFTFLISYTLRPMLAKRYILTFVPMFYMCSAIVVCYFTKYAKIFLFLLTLATTSFYADNYEEVQDRSLFDLRDYVEKDSLIIGNTSIGVLLNKFYLPEYDYIHALTGPELVLMQDRVKADRERIKDLTKYKNIYYIHYEGRYDPLHINGCKGYSFHPIRDFEGCIEKISVEEAEKVLKWSKGIMKLSYH